MRSNKIRVVAAIIAAASVVLPLTACGSGEKTVISDYEKLMNGKKFDSDFVEKLAPEDVWEQYKELYDVDADDISEYLEEEYIENIEDFFPYDLKDDEFKYKYTVVDTLNLKGDALDEAKDSIHDEYDISKKNISAVSVIVVKSGGNFDIDDVDDEYIIDATVRKNLGLYNQYVVAKVEGKWYILDILDTFVYRTSEYIQNN